MIRIALFSIALFTLASPAFALSQSEITTGYTKSFNYEKMGSYSNAIKAMSILYSEYPKGYAINLRMGLLYTYRRNYQNALMHFDTAIATLPDAIEPKLGKMSVLIAQERYTEAIEIGNRIVAVDYYNYYGNLKLAYALSMIGDHDLSDKVLLKMLSIYPTDIQYLAQYGTSLYVQKQWNDAARVFSDVLLFDPENVTAKTLLREIKVAQAAKKKK